MNKQAYELGYKIAKMNPNMVEDLMSYIAQSGKNFGHGFENLKLHAPLVKNEGLTPEIKNEIMSSLRTMAPAAAMGTGAAGVGGLGAYGAYRGMQDEPSYLEQLKGHLGL